MSTVTLRTISVTTEKLVERVQEHFSTEALDVFSRACTFAEEHYTTLHHPVGKPYIEYAAEVAIRLDDLGADSTLISAAMIYPPPPMRDNVLPALQKRFRNEHTLLQLIQEILRLDTVDWNSWSTLSSYAPSNEEKERRDVLQKMFLLSIDEDGTQTQQYASSPSLHFQKKEKQVENLIRMLLTTNSDIHALIFKLVDRLHFIKLLKDLTPSQQEAIQCLRHAHITLAIYAPLADRLGLWRIKSELEDMSFRLIEQKKYKEIAQLLELKKEERKKYISDVILIVHDYLASFGIKAEISGRAKHIYGIYQKMQAKQLAIEDINDLLGIRVIVDTKADCYIVLGALHEHWDPVTHVYDGKAGRDWIAHPKENQYQSLHTTVWINGKMVEVQIRTHDMHEIAEYGADSAHWRYKESKAYKRGKVSKGSKTRDQIWSEHIATIRKNLAGIQEDANSIKKDLQDWIFVITPKGHVIDLQAGATPLDFAYRIHTELGNRYTGAKIGKHLVQLDYKLKNGDIVELIKSHPRKGPSPEWLSRSKDEQGKSDYVFAHTRQAREKIRHWFNAQKHKE